MYLKKDTVKCFLKLTPFYPVPIGKLLRKAYFLKYTKRLPWRNFTKVLDAGCGEGEYSKKLAEGYSHLEIDAFDIKKYKSWDGPLKKNINFLQGDLSTLEKQGFYDFCLCIDVLEHIPENYKVLENIYLALKKGGYFYLHLPKRKERRIFAKRFFKNFDTFLEEEHIGKMYEPEELKDIIVSLGFTIVKSRETFGFFGNLAWEIDRVTDGAIILKVILMPFLKPLSYFDIKFAKKGHGILILAIKS